MGTSMRPPSIRVLSPALTFAGEVLGYTSLVFTRRWYEVGDWELHVPLSAVGAKLLTLGTIIMLDTDGHRSGILDTLIYKEGAQGMEVTARGKTLSALCSYRVTVPPDGPENMGYDTVPSIVTAGEFPPPVPAETVFKEYVRRHMTQAAPDRVIPRLAIAPDQGRGGALRFLSRYEPLHDVFSRLGPLGDMGWEVWTQGGQMIFDVIPGVDRTFAGGLSPVVFSAKYMSIQDLTYTQSDEGSKTWGYVGGEGEDENRLIYPLWIEPKPSGMARREVFLDAGQLNLSDGLEAEGQKKLAEHKAEQSVTASVSPSLPFVYRKDWDLGDLVTVQSGEIGVTFDTRVAEVTEHYEPENLGLSVTFGSPSDKLGRLIRRLEGKVNVR